MLLELQDKLILVPSLLHFLEAMKMMKTMVNGFSTLEGLLMVPLALIHVSWAWPTWFFALFYFRLKLHNCSSFLWCFHIFLFGADSGGRDLSGNKRTNKLQSFDQTFDKFNAALRVSCRNGYPVRVVRLAFVYSFNVLNSIWQVIWKMAVALNWYLFLIRISHVIQMDSMNLCNKDTWT